MNHQVTDIRVHRKSRLLSVSFDDGAAVELPFEYLRVFSPSADVSGHGLAEPRLVGGKQDVQITGVDPVGNYAVRLAFDDAHRTGLYSWDLLYELGEALESNWARYLHRIEAAGMSRDAASNVTPLNQVTGKS